MMPPVLIEPHGGGLVMRDDRVDGGTKARILPAILGALGAREYVYAGPAWGGGALALAATCRDLGLGCTLFYAARADLVPRQRLAQSYGARIETVRPGYLTVVRARARAYCEETGARLIEWGVPAAEEGLARLAADHVVEGISSVWCAMGSGTLARALRRVYAPRGVEVIGVQVGAAPHDLPPGIRTVKHPLAFEVRTGAAVPFPSCRHYDAKAWELAARLARRPFLFWNVMGDHVDGP